MATPKSDVQERGKWDLDGLDDKEVRLIEVSYPPGAATPPHRHPGWQLIYVLEGPVVSQMRGEPEPVEYQTGEWWFEPREHVHELAANRREDGTSKILVFYITEPGQPVLIPE